MTLIDLAPYKPVVGTGSDANLIRNAFDTIQALINGNLDTGNLAAAAAITLDKLTIPAAHAFHSVNQTGLATATTSPLAFNSERFDNAGIHDTVTNNGRLTCTQAGIYAITANVEWDLNATGTRVTGIRLNGATLIANEATPAASTQVTRQSVTAPHYQLALTDYVEVVVFHDSGSNRTINATGNFSPEFSMVRVA